MSSATFSYHMVPTNNASWMLPPTGIGEHDKVGLISNNRWEWAALAAASYSLNAAIVPMVSFGFDVMS
jgi:long-subunit acyl-CoA synthetase (AMP-forming)